MVSHVIRAYNSSQGSGGGDGGRSQGTNTYMLKDATAQVIFLQADSQFFPQRRKWPLMVFGKGRAILGNMDWYMWYSKIDLTSDPESGSVWSGSRSNLGN